MNSAISENFNSYIFIFPVFHGVDSKNTTFLLPIPHFGDTKFSNTINRVTDHMCYGDTIVSPITY